MSTVGRWSRCQTCPSNMIVIRYMWVMVPWWSLEPNKESPNFMTSVGQLSGGLFNVLFNFGDSEVATDGRMDRWCHKLCGDSKVATDGRMDRWCHKLCGDSKVATDGWTDGVTNFATHTHHDCTWHLQHWTFLLFPPPALDKRPCN